MQTTSFLVNSHPSITPKMGLTIPSLPIITMKPYFIHKIDNSMTCKSLLPFTSLSRQTHHYSNIRKFKIINALGLFVDLFNFYTFPCKFPFNGA